MDGQGAPVEEATVELSRGLNDRKQPSMRKGEAGIFQAKGTAGGKLKWRNKLDIPDKPRNCIVTRPYRARER